MRNKFNRLTILKVLREKGRHTLAVCQCECGGSKTIQLSRVVNGVTKSCGCLQREVAKRSGKANLIHGQAIPRHRGSTYRSWESMKQRCYNRNSTGYVNYGGRGLKVCGRWLHSFENFLSDMGERPEGLTLHRVDNNKGYCPDNCEWATLVAQGRCKSNSRLVTYLREEMTLSELSERVGIPYGKLYDRIVRSKWDVTKAVET